MLEVFFGNQPLSDEHLPNIAARYERLATDGGLVDGHAAPSEWFEPLAPKNGVNGVMVEPYDKDMLVERMLEILDNPAKFKHMRAIARQEMVEKYSFEVCLPKLAEFYLGSDSSLTPDQTMAQELLSCKGQTETQRV